MERPEPTDRVEEVLHAAVETPPADRAAYLDRACAGHQAVRDEVESLLEAFDRADPLVNLVVDDEPESTERLHRPSPEASIDFGRYRLIKELGRGGQARVYLAEDQDLGRKVALKILSLPFLATPSILARFRREAEFASRLDHPGIAAVYEAGEVDGVPFIAMRYVDGETLAHRIAVTRETPGHTATFPQLPGVADNEKRPATSRSAQNSTAREQLYRIVHFFQRAAHALHTAHEAGLVHRDIKPANLMITPDGSPVILDFGLVRDVGGDSPTLTRSGDVLGTPHYMAPEQISETAGGADSRSDVYALGATLYECLTLEAPFQAATRDALYQRILNADLVDARRLNHKLPRDLSVVLATALEKSRDRRYQSAFDFAEDLRRVREIEPIRARPASAVLRLGRWAQRNPVVATTVFGLILVLLIAVTLQRNHIRELRHAALLDASERTLEIDPKESVRFAFEAAVIDPDDTRHPTTARSSLPRS